MKLVSINQTEKTGKVINLKGKLISVKFDDLISK